MKTNIKTAAFCMLLLFCLTACKDTNKPDNTNPEPGTEETDVPEGMTRLYISAESSATRKALGITPASYNQFSLKVNGSAYKIEKNDKGAFYADVDKVGSGKYEAVMTMAGSTLWHGSSPYQDITIPYSQFAGTTAVDMKKFPLYASIADGSNKLEFTDGFAVLDLKPQGSATIVSVKVQSSEGFVAGKGAFLPSKGKIQVSDGIGYAVLNCIGEAGGVSLSSGKGFQVIVAAGNYSKGLEITLTDDSHRAMTYNMEPAELKPGEAKELKFNYKPDDDLVWFEGFDNFVWGGDIMGGSSAGGYAPSSENIGFDGGLNRTGYEYPISKVGYTNPGSGFIQPNTWDTVSGKTVGASHQMSESYVRSRGIGDWTYMFRCQEFPGYISVGIVGNARGILRTPKFSNNDICADVRISFDFCFHSDATDELLFEVVEGGMIKNCTIDGVPYELTSANLSYQAASSMMTVGKSTVSVPSSIAAAKQWHRFELEVERAGSGTSLYFAGNRVDSRNHGFFLDNITVRKIRSRMEKPAGTVRLLYWNIQNGMWSDQANNYNNFVKWVKTYDPDICVWCEAASIYKNNTSSSASSSARFLPSGWSTLAARYGHTYSALGGHRDNYPQEVTSKYPITTVLKITDSDVSGKPIAHGGAIQEITVGGRTLSFVTCHMWPQGYGYGVSGDAAREASAAAHEGDYYREFEMDYLMRKTVNNPAYSGREWILLGDLNSRSRLDNWYYKYAADNTLLLTQDVVLNKTDLKDVIHETYPGWFITSTYGTSRIDFVYASPSLMNCVEDAYIVMDGWTNPTVSKYVSSFRDPSDHRPILVDFKF